MGFFFSDPQMSVLLNSADIGATPLYGYPPPTAAMSLSLSSHHQKSVVPLGPFTGYASILKGSRFLRPAHQLLEELCDMGRVMYDPGLLDPHPSNDLGIIVDDCGERALKKSRLLSMLDEVYKRYKQYYQPMQAAVAEFKSIAGLSSAATFTNLALNIMSKHFTCLKNSITD